MQRDFLIDHIRPREIHEPFAVPFRFCQEGGSFEAFPAEGGCEMKKGKARPWQKDPFQLKTERVQIWSPRGTMIGVRSLEQARRSVKEGLAFVICDQAIEYYEMDN